MRETDPIQPPDWNHILHGRLADETRRMRRRRLRAAVHARRVFRILIAATIALVIAGIGVFAWVGVEQYRNERDARQQAAQAAKPDRTTLARYRAMLAEAREYNRRIAATPQVIGETIDPDTGSISGDFTFTGDTDYQRQLQFGDGIMATVRIPCIDVNLPIRHGAGSYALENGVGHLHGSSLPVGGKDTHAVITGHTGIADKTLFTRLTELRKGDVFYIKVADRTLAYRVYDIRTVRPDDLKDLHVEKGRDIVTLVTCTPIFLNTHRLLVTGRRVAMPDDAPYPQDAPRTNANDRRPLMAAGITLLALTPPAILAANRNTSRPYGMHGRIPPVPDRRQRPTSRGGRPRKGRRTKLG